MGAGVVELCRLADDDRAGADDENAVKVGTTWHLGFLCGLVFGGGHELNEAVEKVGGIVRACCRFGVVLDGERGDVEAADAFYYVVVEANMGYFYAPKFFNGGLDRPVEGRIDGEPVVLGGDFNFPSGFVHDGLVNAAVPEGQLVGAEPEGAPQKLVAEADAEERGAFTQNLPEQFYLFVGGCGVAGAVGEEHALRVVGVNVVQGGVGRQHVHTHAAFLRNAGVSWL